MVSFGWTWVIGLLAGLLVGAAPLSAGSHLPADVDEINSIIRSLEPTLPNEIGSAAGGSDQSAILTTPPNQSVPSGGVVYVRCPSSVVVLGRTYIIDTTRLLEIDLFFPLDSSQLEVDAVQSLNAFGFALSSPELRGFTYLIAGHTDASGDAGYNLRLSRQRADAVRDYLLRNFPIDPSRLLAAGFGEERLRAPSRPTAAINRRVEISFVVETSGVFPPRPRECDVDLSN